MRRRRSSTALHYLLAIVSVLLALLLTRLLGPRLVGVDPLFFAAVMITAFAGGLAPGLVATGLAAACGAYFFFEPGGRVFDVDDIVRTFFFIAVAFLISYMHARVRRSEGLMEIAKERAVEANRAKDRFLAVVSHELRNPLLPIKIVASLWENNQTIPEELRVDMSLVRRSVDMESRLIEDLLDLNRITAGKLVLTRERVDLTQVLQDAFAVFDAQARHKGIALRVDMKTKLRVVDGDPSRLRQVMWNLLSNAIKFTADGGNVVLSLVLDEDASNVEIRVSDNGVGIAPAALPRVFDAFEQGGVDVTQRFGGLGLGLAISKSLVEAHGGAITAHSAGPGRGSTFTVRLPLAPMDAPLRDRSPKRETTASIWSTASN
jgi:signal transduction histidine kinase